MNVETPILDLSRGNEAYNKFISLLRSGELKPGDRITETQLAKIFEVSRTPVREALRQLETEGLIVHLPRQGMTVRTLNYEEVVDLYEMRSSLEGTVARLAARFVTDHELDNLFIMNEEFAEASSPQESYEKNKQLHRTLLRIARNKFLAETMNVLEKPLLLLGPTTFSEDERAENAFKEHRQILNAIKNRDGILAEEQMRSHMEAAHKVRLRSWT